QGSDPAVNTDYQAWLANFAGVQSSDICGAITLSYVEGPWNSSDCVDEIQVEFISTDECGLTNSVFRTFTITDTTPPTIDDEGADGTAECQGSDPSANSDYQAWLANFADVQSSDICGEITLSYVEGPWNSSDCVDEIQVEFISTDECGLTNSVFRTFTITDTTIPSIDDPGADGTAECQGSDPAVNTDYQAWLANFAGVQSSDICGAITLSYIEGLWNSSDCVDEIQVEFISTDECGLTNSVFRIFTITDTTPPTIDSEGADGTAECQGSDPAVNTDYQAWLANFAGVNSSDICGEITLSYVEGPWNSSDCVDEIQVEFISTDECGLTNSVFRIFTIIDTTPPTIDDEGADGTAECQGSDPSANSDYQAWLANFAGVQSSDICGEITLSYVEGIWRLEDCVDEIQVEFIATDECGLTNSVFRTFTIMDTTPPQINEGADGSTECTGADPSQNAEYQAWLANFAGVTASDVCGNVTLSATENNWTQENCIYTMVIIVTATDECGLIATQEHTFTITDTTIPEIACPDDTTVDLNTTCEYDIDPDLTGRPTFSDVCDPTPIFTFSDDISALTECNGTGSIVRTWNVSDNCGNFIECVQTITIQDVTEPEVTCPDNVTVYYDENCNIDTDPTTTGLPTVTDNCDLDPIITYDDNLDGLDQCNNSGVIIRTFTVEDACGNTTQCVQEITVIDNIAPEITCPDETTVYFNVDCVVDLDPGIHGVPTYSDNCDNNATIIFVDDETQLTGCNGTGTILRTWTVTDACGNSATCLQTFIIEDNTLPEIICPEETTVYFNVDCGYDLSPDITGRPTISDNCDDNAVIFFEDDITGLTECSGTGTILRTWTATDECGNTATCLQTFIIEDNTEPQIICPDETTIEFNVDCGVEIDPQVTGYPEVIDNCDEAPLIYFVDDNTGLDGCNGTGTIIRTWTVTDACGNTATCEQTFIIQDNTEPEISCPPITTIYFASECEMNIDPSFTGSPTITDNCDINPIITFTDDITQLTECNGTGQLVRTWTVEDACGNTAQCSQTIIVQDNTEPEVTCPPDATVSYDESCDLNLDPDLLGRPTVTDNCDEMPTMSYEDNLDGLNQCNNTGIIVRTWTVVDACDNITQCVQNIEVFDDTTPTITCPEDITLNCPSSTDPSVTGTADGMDNCGVLDVTYTDVSSPNCGNTEIITRTWTVTDLCGQTASCEQIITIVDETPPVMSNPDELTVSCDISEAPIYTDYSEFVGANGSANDECALDESSFIWINDVSDGNSCPETVTRVYQISDACGNTSTSEQTIIIHDMELPTITCPEDITLECDGNGNTAEIEAWLNSATASDNCGEPIITHNFTGLDGECEGLGSATVTWTALDECGNFVTCSAMITIIDTNNPTADDIVDVTVQYFADIPNIDIEVVINESDGCDPNPIVTFVNETDNGGSGCDGDPYILIRTYNIADCSGNNINVDQEITVETPPLVLDFFTTSILCSGESTGSIAIEASGGTAPYSYDWDNDVYDGQTLLEDLPAGAYSVTVTDVNGCIAIENIMVEQVDEALSIELGPENPVICIDGDLVIYVTAQGGTQPYIYTWSVSNFADDSIRVSSEGTYSVTVTDANGCSDQASIDLNVIDDPQIDRPQNMVSCDSVILPEITGTDLSGNQAYYTEENGQGTRYEPGDVIFDSQRIYIYDETGTEPNCFDEVFFRVTITPSPQVFNNSGVACDRFILPEINGNGLSGNESYWSGPGGTGNQYFPGDAIASSTILYIFDSAGNCPSEAEMVIDIVETPVIDPNSGSSCDQLQLPEITGVGTNGATYNTQPDGSGTSFNPGEFVNNSQTLYMIVAAGSCGTMEPFEVVITPTAEIDNGAGADCDEFILPEITGSNLSGNESYFTQPDGGGNEYRPGDRISNDIILYIFGDANGCPSEATFEVSIVETPQIDPNSGSACDSLELPAITGPGTGTAMYWENPDGTGTSYTAGDFIDFSTTLYMVVAAGDCGTMEAFEVSITDSPVLDDLTGAACDEFILPEITGSNLSGNEAYYTEANGSGTRYVSGDAINFSTTLFIYDANGICDDEAEIVIDIVETPQIDPNSGSACDSLELPAITGPGTGTAMYWENPDGTGTSYTAGDFIDFST
ncbi:SprB repeat-containing protein, partial [Portibacter marinus]|uniref:SprB repeat-containing protein n=1 Tax=Portibacter marinus TaxID=2898660 RepID=UPI001F222540